MGIGCGTCAMSKPIGHTQYTIDLRIFDTPLVLLQFLSLPVGEIAFLSFFVGKTDSFIGKKLNHFQLVLLLHCRTQTRPIARIRQATCRECLVARLAAAANARVSSGSALVPCFPDQQGLACLPPWWTLETLACSCSTMLLDVLLSMNIT